MITDFDTVESGVSPEVDVCVVGSGVAGLTIANQFIGRGRRVMVLEAGGRNIAPESQAMYRAQVVGSPYIGHREGRFRVFGGTSTRWGGQLLTLDPDDFKPRQNVAHSGWPLRFEDIDPYYRRTLEFLRADDLPYDRAIWPAMKLKPLPFDESIFRYRYAKWIPFRYRNIASAMDARLARATDVEVLLNATAAHIQLDPTAARVDHLVIRSVSGKQGKVRARHFVLCCGAIETARLLLASNDVQPQGVGNGHDIVGRYFQDHITRRCADLSPDVTRQYVDSFSPFFVGNVMHSPRLELRPEAQERFGCLSAFAQVLAEPPEDSGFVVVREMLRRMQALQGFLPTGTEVINALRDLPYVVRLGISRYFGGRIPYPPRCQWRLAVDVEQEPNPESRIFLTGERDALGMPVPAIDWRVGERERRTAAQYVALFRREWERLEAGEAVWDETIDEPGDRWFASASDTYHQAGTTRMGDDPRASVVNTDLRVHGVDNLYVGSCSVFPTSGSANPTFTMTALCLRLADHLHNLA